MAKGLVKNVSRKTARSYERTTPNGAIGVTAIASVNGRGAFGRRAAVMGASIRAKRRTPRSMAGSSYEERYAATRGALLRSGVPRWSRNDGMPAPVTPAPAAPKTATPNRRRRAKEREETSMKRKRSVHRRYAANKRKQTPAQRAASIKNLAKGRRAQRKGKSAARKSTAKRTRRSSARTSGRISVKIGNRTRKTYFERTKGGGVRHVPYWKTLGFRSEKDMAKKAGAMDEAGKAKLSTRQMKIIARRRKAADRTAAHGDIFTPNARVIPYEEWSATMTPNGRRRRKRRHSSAYTANKRLTKAQRSAAAKKGWRKRGRKASTVKRRAAGKTRSTAKRGKRTAAQRSASARKAARTRKRNASKGHTIRGTFGGKRGKRHAGKRTAAQRSASARKAARTRKRNASKGHATSKRSSGKRSGKGRRRRANGRFYNNNGGFRRRKFTANAYMAWITDVATQALPVAAGFFGHKAASYALGNYGLANVTQLNTPALAPWRGVLAAALVAAVGVPVAYKVVPAQSAKLAVGMVLSLIHAVISKATAGTPVQAYLAGYPDAEGRAYLGEYVATGEYMATSGFGDPRFSQAAAGYGQFTQAAAGYGDPRFSQAAAGLGAGYSQAAAGYGDYTEEGIVGGDLSAAEHALNVSEAVAGYGAMSGGNLGEYMVPQGTSGYGEYEMTASSGYGDIPMHSIQDPTGQTQGISDEPTGARAGILQGGQGIFG